MLFQTAEPEVTMTGCPVSKKAKLEFPDTLEEFGYKFNAGMKSILLRI